MSIHFDPSCMSNAELDRLHAQVGQFKRTIRNHPGWETDSKWEMPLRLHNQTIDAIVAEMMRRQKRRG